MSIFLAINAATIRHVPKTGPMMKKGMTGYVKNITAKITMTKLPQAPDKFIIT